MNPVARSLSITAILAAITLTHDAHSAGLVNIAMRPVGDAGNAADANGIGAVPYEYSIGKYEVTLSQYAAFLNSAAAVTTSEHIRSLWNAQMADNSSIKGIARNGLGTVESPYIYGVIGDGNKPVTWVTWFDAARFCNWLHNGATNGASTETGAYTLNGATSGLVLKNPDANWWIPGDSEWYKAAYYKKGGTNAGYWQYPTRSDAAPGNLVGTAANQANYYNGVFSVTQINQSGADNLLTAGGSYANSAGPYGTFDQGGNVYEWTDYYVAGGNPVKRARRGGSWSHGSGLMLSSVLDENTPGSEDPFTGFRVAGMPAAQLTLVLEAVPDLTRTQWRAVSMTKDDVSDDGTIRIAPLSTNTNWFYRLKITVPQ